MQAAHSRISRLCALLSCLILPVLAAAAPPPWVWSNPSPQGNPLNASASGNGVNVAVGAGGSLYSNAGGTWSSRSSGTGNNLYAVAYGSGAFVAVGQADTIVASTDGVNWTPVSVSGANAAQNLFSIAFGNNTFVAADSAGTVFTSNNGTTWTNAGSLPAPSTVTSMTFGDGKFVAIAKTGGATAIYYSTTGSTWTAATASFPQDPSVYLTYNGSVFVAMGLNVQGTTGGSIMTSPDGVNWSIQTPLAPATAFPIAITANGSTFVVMLQGGYSATAVTTPILIETSTDGAHWTTLAQNNLPAVWSQNIPRQISYTGSGYLAVGAGAYIATSPDLLTWTNLSPVTAVTYSHLRGIHWLNSQYFVVGDGDTVLTSPDGTNWTLENNSAVSPTSNLRDIAYGAGRYVAVGSNGVVLTSADGSSWTASAALPANVVFASLVWNGKQFVTVGMGGAIYSSPDGLTWTAQNSGTKDNLWGIVWTGTEFVAVSDNATGDNAVVIESPDGINWSSTPFNTGSATALYGINWNGAELIVAGSAVNTSGQTVAIIGLSSNGTTWSVDYSNISDVFSDAMINGNQYVAVGQATVYISSDGKTWTAPTPSIQSVRLQNLEMHDGVLLASGYAGTIIHSTTLAPTASNGSITTVENSPAVGTLEASGSELTFAVVTQPAHGSVTLTNSTSGAFTYTPAAGYVGADSFTFTASNSGGTSNTATESITVTVAPPVATNGTLKTTAGNAVSGTLTANGTGPLTFAIVTQPSHGTVTLTSVNTGTFTYTPSAGFTGEDSFTFAASNGGGISNTATESITVTVAPPVATNGSLVTTTGNAANGTLTASGTGPLTYAVVSQPPHGTVVLSSASTGAFTYIPDAGFTGTWSFTFTASNSGGTSNTATVSIMVNAVPPPPPPPSTGGGGGGGSLGFFGLLLLAAVGLWKHARERR